MTEQDQQRAIHSVKHVEKLHQHSFTGSFGGATIPEKSLSWGMRFQAGKTILCARGKEKGLTPHTGTDHDNAGRHLHHNTHLSG